MIGRSWTTKKAERVWKRLRAGVHVETLAADEGCTVTNIHRRLRTAGYSPSQARRVESAEEMQAAKIYAMRKAGQSFEEIAVELGQEPGTLTMRRLYMRLVRYCERAEVPYPKMPKKSRPGRRGGPHTKPDYSLVDGCVAMMKKHPQPMSIEDFAEKVGVDARIAKRIVAEMRRRRLLADGIVPIKGATTEEHLTGSEVFVFEAVREAWNDKDQQCHSLGSLVDYGRYARHTLSIAIIKLRKLGLVEARGGLYLREHA